MALFLWKKSYEIGVSEIDMQHRHLVGIINELSDAMMNKVGYRSVPHVLEKLEEYIQLHFTTEEEIMHKLQYPALAEHRQEHLDMTKKVLEFKKRFLKSQELGAAELLDFLCSWLKNHIAVSDKGLGTYILRSGGTQPSTPPEHAKD